MDSSDEDDDWDRLEAEQNAILDQIGQAFRELRAMQRPRGRCAVSQRTKWILLAVTAVLWLSSMYVVVYDDSGVSASTRVGVQYTAFALTVALLELVACTGAECTRNRARRWQHGAAMRQVAMHALMQQRLGLEDDDRDFTANDYEWLLALDEDTPTTRLQGATQPQINRLPTFTYKAPRAQSDDAEGRSCRICLADFEDGDKLRIVPCFHRFHQGCIDRWLLQKAECPVCKAPARGNEASMLLV